MKVHELIDWLQGFEDQEATVEVVVSEPGTGYYDQGGVSSITEFDPTKHAEYTDFRDNPFTTPEHPCFGKRLLLLGAHDA